MSDISKKLWVEKYAPKDLEDMILPDPFRAKFKSYIEEGECPHLMLSGIQGSGKTTISKILISKIIKDDADILIINGSKDNGVDYIRNTLDSFLVCPPYGSKIKICMIDEADYLSGNAQAALRGIIERYQETARFIMTINYPHKIIEPLKSRLQLFEFKKLPFEYIHNHIIKILQKESIKFDDKMIDKIIKTYYPDVRRIIGTIEKNCDNNVLESGITIIEEIENDIIKYFTKILECIENNDMHILKISITNIQNIINGDNGIDYLSLYDRLFNHDRIPFYAKLCVGESLEGFPSAAVPSIHFLTCILKVIRAGLSAKNIKFYV